jgi:hypothetical protein
MKKLVLFIVFVFTFGFLGFSQTFDYEVAETNMSFALEQGVSQDLVNHGFATNLNPFTNNLYWVRTEISMPDGWESAICDKTACYTPVVGERALNLSATEQSIFDLHLYTEGFPGDMAIIKLCIFEVADTSTSQCHTYTFSALSSAEDQLDQEVSLMLYPNPATNYFTVVSEQPTGKVELYNIIGAKLRTFDSRNQSEFEVSDLSPGIYLARIYDAENTRVLSTLRLKKR